MVCRVTQSVRRSLKQALSRRSRGRDVRETPKDRRVRNKVGACRSDPRARTAQPSCANFHILCKRGSSAPTPRAPSSRRVRILQRLDRAPEPRARSLQGCTENIAIVRYPKNGHVERESYGFVENPVQWRTGNGGYFLKRGSVLDFSHNQNSLPLAERIVRACWQVAHRPTRARRCESVSSSTAASAAQLRVPLGSPSGQIRRKPTPMTAASSRRTTAP